MQRQICVKLGKVSEKFGGKRLNHLSLFRIHRINLADFSGDYNNRKDSLQDQVYFLYDSIESDPFNDSPHPSSLTLKEKEGISKLK